MAKAIGILYTGWPKKNATTLIINFKDIVNKTIFFFFFFFLLGVFKARALSALREVGICSVPEYDGVEKVPNFETDIVSLK